MQAIETAIKYALKEGKLPCAIAHALARENGWSPRQVGQRANELGVKISYCQLGLFGYDMFGKKRLIEEYAMVPENVAAAIFKRAVNGKVPCADAWEIAAGQGLPRLTIGSSTETIELKVGPCQLGCF